MASMEIHRSSLEPYSPRKKKISLDSNANQKEFDLWKWSLIEIGAICSFEVAATTMCIIIFGSQQRNQHNHKKLCFQIYADDKRIKQVVQQATKLNEAISVVRGVPIARVRIKSVMDGWMDLLWKIYKICVETLHICK
ncbi:hypothetical protein LWI28_028389 [Acer negundo]|uniref:DUF6821 domain-containing protein n=1 Tax=Acer negundo TaxID=4023 RepID=A0AAD5NRQ1_ACENE|nr:hypothetical protein LWI28_028389 [Acer negundo]KAK4850653.1 hypothetical protein QYF36_008642 [Acer negundo]